MNICHLMRHRYLRLPVALMLAACLAGCVIAAPGSQSAVHTPAVAVTSTTVASGTIPDAVQPETLPPQLTEPAPHNLRNDAPNRLQDATLRLATAAWTNAFVELGPTLCKSEPVLMYRCSDHALLPLVNFDADPANPGRSAETNQALSEVPEPVDLWDRLRRGFRLAEQEHRRIALNIAWHVRHRTYLNRVAKRASRYLYWITEAVEKYGMPSEIALLPVVESAFQPFAYSHGRAAGIWQFIPNTGRLFGLKQNWWYDGRRDVVASTQAALTYLNRLQAHFDGDWLLALAAYNSGEGTVEAAIRKNRRHGKPTDFWALDLPQETRDYVPKLLAITALVKHPERYAIELAPLPNEPYMTKVEIGSQIDLALAAELAEISLNELYLLNPGFNRWATDPNGPHYLVLPVDNVESFLENLTQLPATARVKWERHSIRRGETLLQIAARYHTDVESIQKLNRLRGSTIRAGQSLIVPVSSKHLSNYTLSAGQRLRRLQNQPRRSASQKVIHRVRRGDTLWDISRKFDISVRRLAAWNGLAPRDTLRPGQKLVIWLKQAATRPVAFSPYAGRLVTRKIRYRVRQGECLAVIAHKFSVTVNDLLQWNQIDRPNYLRPGDKLTLYVNVTEQTGI